MVNIYKQEKKTAAPKAFETQCVSLDILGRGVCKHEDKVYFVPGLLPGERARIMPTVSDTDKTASGVVTKLIAAAPERVTNPCCDHQASCGGCPLMHLPPQMAFDAKVQGVAKLLVKSVLQGTLEAKSGKASAAVGQSRLGRNSTIKQALAQKQAAAKNAARASELAALSREAAAKVGAPSFTERGPTTGYRRACRLAIRADHGKLYLGFRKDKSSELVPVSSCPVLEPRLNALLAPLTALVNTLEQKKSIGHVELLASDLKVAVLLRMTQKLEAADEQRLLDFGAQHSLAMFVLEPFKQLDDSEVVRERLLGAERAADDTGFSAAEQQIMVQSLESKVYCSPSCFVQVNAQMNTAMLKRVLAAVEPHEGQKVLDLFSGLGNFSLPIAAAGSEVVGIDIVFDMIRRANANAAVNGVADKAKFYVADLEEPFENQLWAKADYDVVVMDPGRMGAKRAVQFMGKLKPKKIVMISCNPLAAARDCSQLLSSHYKIEMWGAFDMFPHTSHVEIMLVFTRD
ncbi:MAG TPA: 23S rRNA (uracil(1939)-C(5))-methyltransferase RlmD [Candidatus Anaerobiospirillum stercoravium]|nr:23S rRNA (uracil(1939)-C(5))-methyltransferase RlmD [Candidatus Anaerobiospirillum stercoravium]